MITSVTFISTRISTEAGQPVWRVSAGCSRNPLSDPIPMTKDNQEAWWARYTLVNRMVDEADLVDIGLPMDGKSFNDPTLEDLRYRVLTLIDMGYRVPPGVLERIEEEIQDATEPE